MRKWFAWNERKATILALTVIILLSATLGGVLINWVRDHYLTARNMPKFQLPKGEAQNPQLADSDAIINVVGNVGPGVVLISTSREQVVYDWFLRPMMQREQGLGSGVIFDAKGYILTNNHVIEDAKEIQVILPDQRSFIGKKIGGDTLTDIAIVKIEGKDLPVIPLGDSDKIKVGQTVIAIGNPYGFDNTVTTGVISALARSLSDPQRQIFLEDLIQTDASINPGNSGGPLINLQGQVIGINTAIIQQAQGIGFAIPINRAREVAEALIKHGRVIRLGVLGTELTPQTAAAIEAQTGKKLPVKQGIFLTSVLKDQPADRAGLISGDIITRINGQPARKMTQLQAAVRKAGFGGRIQLEIYRQGRRLRKTVELK